MTEPGKIRLEKDKETYLATLWGKALDAGVERPILGDRFAAEAVARIDLDFRTLKLPSGGEITLPMRALHFDRWTRAFLADNPEATVLHLGCGLDARVDLVRGVRSRGAGPPPASRRGRLFPDHDRAGLAAFDHAGEDGDVPVLEALQVPSKPGPSPPVRVSLRCGPRVRNISRLGPLLCLFDATASARSSPITRELPWRSIASRRADRGSTGSARRWHDAPTRPTRRTPAVDPLSSS
jgi:hypothetical protein